MPFPELPEGQTHSWNDGCGEIAHNKVTAKSLTVGVSYVHKNGWGYRTIIEISPDRKTVYYKWEDGRPGYCSAAHFAETLPKVATREDIERINKNNSKIEDLESIPVFLPGVKRAINQIKRYKL